MLLVHQNSKIPNLQWVGDDIGWPYVNYVGSCRVLLLQELPKLDEYDALILFWISFLEKVLRHEDLQGAPLLVFANKQVRTTSFSAHLFPRKGKLYRMKL